MIYQLQAVGGVDLQREREILWLVARSAAEMIDRGVPAVGTGPRASSRPEGAQTHTAATR
ncbi:MAG: hypothetical protein CMJ59_07920 [Planctomycetaceae bacterium]|nr:hypothetical protein [Planctomycetaceae bacterium]